MGEYVVTDTEPPEPVPLVRNWLPDAQRGWLRFMYGGRRRFWIAWGWLLLVVLLWVALKAGIYWTGVIILTVVWLISALYDLGTYPVRRHGW